MKPPTHTSTAPCPNCSSPDRNEDGDCAQCLDPCRRDPEKQDDAKQAQPKPTAAEWTFHPFAAMLPLLDPAGDEMQYLAQDIAEHGQQEPAILFEDKILDGRNRATACTIAGRKLRTRKFTGTRFEALALVWSLNRRRRHLNPGQAAIAEEKRARMHQEYAAEIQKAKSEQPKGGRPKNGKPREIIPEVSEENRRIDTKRAKAAGTNRRYLADARALLDTAPDLAELVEAGTKSMPIAIREVKQRKRHAQRMEAAKDVQVHERVIVGDFRDHAEQVPDGSVSLIFTDPPYDRKAEELFAGLADFAAAKLAPGGSLLFYCGVLQLPAALATVGAKLRYWWTTVCLHQQNHTTLMHELGIRNEWKPIVWFVKETRDDRQHIVKDVVGMGREKEHHDWQQSEAEASYWIDHLCPKDGMVVDPFLGGGTTAAAAKALGRQWLGFEIDPDTARIASARLQA